MTATTTARRAGPPAGAKLRAPRLGRVFGRERLFAQLDASARIPGVWIAGPPGIGKTTLVATYLEARAIPCLWLQLDAGDADAASFVHFLRSAAVPLAPQRRLRLPAPTADDLRDVPALLRRCVRRLAEVINAPWVLVLDNVQELGAAPLLHAGIAAALAELPEGARLIAISRDPPPPAYARALAGQQLGLVDERSLRFDDDDTQRLLALHRRAWSPTALRELTDGWAAAMVLLLAARNELGPDDALRSGTARERLFDFFAGEVLDKMSAPDAATLLRIAFLPSATAAMAVRISGDVRAAALLADLARRSLFTDCREGTPPAYSFHALFGEFLRARAVATLGPEALRALRLRAADVLAGHGHADAGISQLVAAGAWDEALALLLAHAGRFVAQGRTASVRDWLLALPDTARAGPQAAYWLGWCEMATQPADALRHFERARLGFAASAAIGDGSDAGKAGEPRGAGNARHAEARRGEFETAAAAADVIVFVGASLHALDPWMPVLEAQAPAWLAQRTAPRQSHAAAPAAATAAAPTARPTDLAADLRVLPGLLAAFVYREPGHALTAPLADLAERLLEQPLGASQRILLAALAYYLLWTGQTARLDRIIIKIDRLCAAPDAAPATLLRWYGVGVIVRSLLGRVDEALAHARHALALAGDGPAPMRARAELLMVLAAVAARDAELARAHLAQAAAVLDPANAIDATTFEFQRALLMLLDGEWHDAAALMRAAVASGRASGWPLREHIALLGQALTATQVGAFDAAEASLRAVRAHPFNAVCVWHHWLAALIEAQLAERRGDRPRCLAALAQAFAIGREHGFDFGPMPYACGDMMARLAGLALAHDIEAPFARRLIRRHALPAPAAAAADADEAAAAAAGERWPWPVRIRTLGRFTIERDGVPAAAARKESRKPLDLLKLLIALGGQGLPVARLAAALWPEAPGDAARNSFDNALHRLRKLLGGDAHVTLRAGAASLNAATCWTDLRALEACLEAIDASAFRGHAEGADDGPADGTAASARADQVLALWQGEFLAGDDDLPDVLVARSRLQARITRLMGVLGARLETAGRHAEAARLYARVLEHQPLAEDICRHLIGCLIRLGQRAEAYEAYRRCRQQLSVVLGIRPAPQTDALVADLRDL